MGLNSLVPARKRSSAAAISHNCSEVTPMNSMVLPPPSSFRSSSDTDSFASTSSVIVHDSLEITGGGFLEYVDALPAAGFVCRSDKRSSR